MGFTPYPCQIHTLFGKLSNFSMFGALLKYFKKLSIDFPYLTSHK